MRSRFLAQLVFALGVAFSHAGVARADAYDLSLYKLGNPERDAAANVRFRGFTNELGVAISNFTLAPPETTGFSGFNFAFEYPISLVNDSGTVNGVRYWPTQGAPRGALQMPGLHVRKGLPFSFEVGSRVNYLSLSSMFAGTIEAKWALNEGFTYIPDIGVRGFGTTLIGAKEFNLTVAGLDLSIGKQIPLLGMATLTPYFGWTSLWVAASSDVIDFRPDQPQVDQFSDGSLGTGSTNVFQSVGFGTTRHDRFYLGARFIVYVLEIGFESSLGMVRTDVVEYDVWTHAAKIGLDF